MNCRDFERAWNEQWDARDAVAPDQARALEVHAAACPACRALSLRYQTLRQVHQSLGPAPAPTAEFTARVVAAYEGTNRSAASRTVPFRRILYPLAAAAACLLAVFWGLRWSGVNSRPVESRAPQVAEHDDAPLTDALADATAATWDLARAASAPAARLGREALSSAVEPATPSATVPDEAPATVAIGAATGLLHNVGARVNEGVRPLSGTARHAFGFLFDSAPDDAKKPPAPAHGA